MKKIIQMFMTLLLATSFLQADQGSIVRGLRYLPNLYKLNDGKKIKDKNVRGLFRKMDDHFEFSVREAVSSVSDSDESSDGWDSDEAGWEDGGRVGDSGSDLEEDSEKLQEKAEEEDSEEEKEEEQAEEEAKNAKDKQNAQEIVFLLLNSKEEDFKSVKSVTLEHLKQWAQTDKDILLQVLKSEFLGEDGFFNKSYDNSKAMQSFLIIKDQPIMDAMISVAQEDAVSSKNKKVYASLIDPMIQHEIISVAKFTVDIDTATNPEIIGIFKETLEAMQEKHKKYLFYTKGSSDGSDNNSEGEKLKRGVELALKSIPTALKRIETTRKLNLKLKNLKLKKLKKKLARLMNIIKFVKKEHVVIVVEENL